MTMTADEIRKHRDKIQAEGGRGGEGKSRYWRMKEPGTKYLRIGRPWVKDGEIWKELIIHKFWHKGQARTVYCGHNIKGTKCAVCRRRKKLDSEGRNTYTKKLFGLCSQQIEAYWNVLVATTVKELPNGKVIPKGYEDNCFKVLQVGRTAHGEILDLFSEPEYMANSPLGVASHKDGYVVRMKRIGKGLDTEYKFKVIGDPRPISKDPERLKSLGKTLNNLDKLTKASSEEELKAYVHMAEKVAKQWAKSQEVDTSDTDSDEEEFDDDTETGDEE